MTTAVAPKNAPAIERALVQGDLSGLTEVERIAYYQKVCDSLGLNPFTRPFDYLKLNGKIILYAKKDCADQLRASRNISIRIVSREERDGVLEVVARATTPDGREDEDVGAVSIKGLAGDALANARMKATTKSKRRVTLSICGLGFLDESELETIADVRPVQPEAAPQVEHKAAKSKGVLSGEQLQKVLDETALKWEEAGYVDAEYFWMHLYEWAEARGCTVSVTEWPNELCRDVRGWLNGWLNELKAVAKKRKEGEEKRQPGDEPTESS